MKKVLVLGAGLVAPPLVRYLLDQPDLNVTVADLELDKARRLVQNHDRGSAIHLPADDPTLRDQAVAQHDLTISLLPAALHPAVAESCLRNRKHMVTTSYVSPQMKSLHQPAKNAGLTFLNETGVDPGIDHMSAMRVIHDVQNRGGTINSFRSYCGGLPAPDANDNPWGYKFAWSPRAVCSASLNPARYKHEGRIVDVPASELFDRPENLHIENVGTFEAYPNRDALGYIHTYGLENVQTMLRATLRHPGWCATLKRVIQLNMLDETPVTYPPNMTWAQWTASRFNALHTQNLRQQLARKLDLQESHDVLDRLEWLGLLNDQPLPITATETTPLDLLASQMGRKMAYQPGQRDMIAMIHKFTAQFPDQKSENITSTLVTYGDPQGDSAMARTVGLPPAIAARLILAGQITDTGVHIPVKPEIYEPILHELDHLGIRCIEQTE